MFMLVRYIGQFKFKRPIRTRIHVFSIRTGDVFYEHNLNVMYGETLPYPSVLDINILYPVHMMVVN